jgi:NAD(P)H dehydrogenase (quinone)
VFTHPCRDSLAASVYERVLDGLLVARHELRTIELYESEFRPGRPLPVEHVDMLTWAESLVLVYPTWWSGQPALLCAWVGAAARRGLPTIRTVVCVTTLGGRRLTNKVSGESGRHFIRRSVLRSCATGARFRWLALYGLDRDVAAERAEFLVRVEQRIGRLVG